MGQDNTIYKKNAAALREGAGWNIGEAEFDSGNYKVRSVASKAGPPVPLAEIAGKEIPLHSKMDPLREAERFVSGIDGDNIELYVVLGFGYGYHVEALLKKIRSDASVVVLEKFSEIIDSALGALPLEHLFCDERLTLLVNPGEEDVIAAFKGKATSKVTFVTHRGCHRIDPDGYNGLLERARSALSTKDVNIATLARFEKTWSMNLGRNILTIGESPGIHCFYDAFRDIPAIVVSAGPSLDESLSAIKELQDRCVIISVDTSLRILLHHDIEPHFCVAVDPQVLNARYFEGLNPEKTVLIADPTVHPSVFRLFRGRKAVSGVAFDMMKWIEDYLGEGGSWAHGGSVSTNAYDFARRSGASPVILVGQDLAFTEGRAHAKGSWLDEQVHLRTKRIYSVEMFNRMQLTALPSMEMPSIKGGKVLTSQKMMIFLSWFQKRAKEGFINSTYDGLIIDGAQHVPMEEHQFPDLSEDIDNIIDSRYLSACKKKGRFTENMKALKGRLLAMKEELEALLPLCRKGAGLSEQLEDTAIKNPGDRGKMQFIVKKLDEVDREIEAAKAVKDMVSLTAQRVIHTITEGYDLDEEEASFSEEVKIARRSAYLYRGFLEAGEFNMKVIEKMLSIIVRTE